MVAEITVSKLAYDGAGDLGSRLDGEMNSNADLDELRLEVYLEGSSLREPYTITMTTADLAAERLIDRSWPYDPQIEFQLWGTPQASPSQPDHQNDTKLGTAAITAPGSGTADIGLGGDVSLHYSVSDSSSPTSILATLDDFHSESDDGLPFVEKSVVYRLAAKFVDRSDTHGVGGGSDGYPDSVVDVVDQTDSDYCACASLLANFGFHEPRRLVEFCRSLYQPQSRSDDGERRWGFLTKSVATYYTRKSLGRYYEHRRTTYKRSKEAAFVDLLLALLRETLSDVRAVRTISGQQSDSKGMSDPEIGAMMEELLPVTGTTVNNIGNRPMGSVILRSAQLAINNDNAVILSIDSSLVQTPNSLSKIPTIDHAITPLDTNVPAPDETGGVPDPVTIDFQNSYGGKASSMTFPKSVVDRYVFGIIVGDL